MGIITLKASAGTGAAIRIFDLLPDGSQVAVNPGNAKVVCKAADAPSAHGQVFRAQVRREILVQDANRNLTGAAPVLMAESRPAAVHGNITCQSAPGL